MDTTPQSRRIEHLETVVRALRDELAQLRREVRDLAESNGRAAERGELAARPQSMELAGGAETEGATPGTYGAPGVARRAPAPADPGLPEPRLTEVRLGEQRLAPARAASRARSAGGPPPRYEATAVRREPPDPLAARPIRSVQLPAAWSGLDLEEVVGRYGTTAIAALLIVMGVGAFLTWAIASGLLGPAARVVLGAIAALVVAGLGVRLRRRGAPRFGNHLLALALAIIHVDAWAAGPNLHLVPSAAALAVAAAASLGLAALALTDGEQTLFNVGAGGALLAPFVTSSESGNVFLLLAYGWVIIASSHAAVRPHRWAAATWLLFAGCAVYTIVAITTVPPQVSWLRGDVPALFALLCAWSAFLLGSQQHRAGFSLGYVAIALVALFATAVDRATALDVIPIAAAATASVYLMLELRASERPYAIAAAILLPLGFLGVALIALPSASEMAGAGIAAAWAAGAGFAAYSDDEERWGPHLVVLGLAGTAAVVLAFSDHRAACVVALSAYAAGLSVLLRRTRSAALLVPILVALGLATGWAYELLQARPAYAYTPFATLASGVALVTVVVGWSTLAWLTAHTEWVNGPPAGIRDWRTIGAAGAVAGLLWGREELARAFSPEIATFLLILYYAAAGVAAIHVGRWRGIPGARRAGLALAMYAALKAVVQASALTLVGLRVGSYLLVGCFLLAVAYWYRATAEQDSAAPLPEP